MSGERNWRFYARPAVYNEGLEVWIRRGPLGVVTNIEVMKVEEGAYSEPAFMNGHEGAEFLRAALNCAWDAGLRPDGFHDKQETFKAVDAHLQDMRTIAFHKLGIKE
jgi:hypothetical protein